MPLLGSAAMLLSFDIEPGAIEEHDRWHTHEHLPERLSIPGFRRGTRWLAAGGGPRYMVVYEVESLATLSSPAYLARLEQPVTLDDADDAALPRHEAGPVQCGGQLRVRAGRRRGACSLHARRGAFGRTCLLAAGRNAAAAAGPAWLGQRAFSARRAAGRDDQRAAHSRCRRRGGFGGDRHRIRQRGAVDAARPACARPAACLHTARARWSAPATGGATRWPPPS